MQNKKLIIGFASVCMICLFVSQSFIVRAAWVPNSNQALPIQDCQVVVSDSIGNDELTNYGLETTLRIGNYFGSDYVSAIKFDLDVPSDALSLNFSSDYLSLGEGTRTLKVFIFLDLDWVETEQTGIENAFGALNLFIAANSEANLTTVLVSGTSGTLDIEIPKTYWSSNSITLVFAGNVLDENKYIWLNSKEATTYSTSNPPHVTYTVPDDGSDPNSGLIGGIIVLGIIVACCVIRKKKQ